VYVRGQPEVDLHCPAVVPAGGQHIEIPEPVHQLAARLVAVTKVKSIAKLKSIPSEIRFKRGNQAHSIRASTGVNLHYPTS